MNAPASKFRWSDAWLLLAIGYCDIDTPPSLARVIAAADAIQHAVLTWEEVDGGFHRLIDAGYVTYEDGRARLSAPGRALLDRLSAHTVSARQDQLEALLGSPPWTNHNPAGARDTGQGTVVPVEDYQAAVAQYTKHPARTLGGR